MNQITWPECAVILAAIYAATFLLFHILRATTLRRDIAVTKKIVTLAAKNIMKYLVLAGMVAGCNQKTKKWVPSPTQKEYLATLPLEGRAYFDSCLRDYADYFGDCLKSYRQLGIQQPPSGGGTSILKTAAGTALGYGAAKLLIGK